MSSIYSPLSQQERDAEFQNAVERELNVLLDRIIEEEKEDSDGWQVLCEALGGPEPQAQVARHYLRELLRAGDARDILNLADKLYDAVYTLGEEIFRDDIARKIGQEESEC